jgi:hypothetical protein
MLLLGLQRLGRTGVRQTGQRGRCCAQTGQSSVAMVLVVGVVELVGDGGLVVPAVGEVGGCWGGEDGGGVEHHGVEVEVEFFVGHGVVLSLASWVMSARWKRNAPFLPGSLCAAVMRPAATQRVRVGLSMLRMRAASAVPTKSLVAWGLRRLTKGEHCTVDRSGQAF